MKVTADREAGFPGDRFDFEVVPDPGCTEGDIRWSGGGDPPAGAGRRFSTAFAAEGTHSVTAACGDSVSSLGVEICRLETWFRNAREFYGSAIDFGRVRVKGSRLVIGAAGTGWTCSDVIRFKRPRTVDELPDESTLIHELGHVWQHQSGQAQLLRGIVEQLGKRFGRDPYNFGGPEGVRQASRLTDFRKEAQAEILRSYWMALQGRASDIHGALFATPGYVDDLRRLVESGIGAPRTRSRSMVGALDTAVARLVNAILR